MSEMFANKHECLWLSSILKHTLNAFDTEARRILSRIQYAVNIKQMTHVMRNLVSFVSVNYRYVN